MPTTMSEHKKALRKPPLCELLPVRDYLDGVAVQMDGSFVAGYELDGLNSYYHDDDMRNRSKRAFEALVRSLPERSMRMQVRFEITEGIDPSGPLRRWCGRYPSGPCGCRFASR